MKKLRFNESEFAELLGTEDCWKAQSLFDAWWDENVMKAGLDKYEKDDKNNSKPEVDSKVHEVCLD